MESYLQKFGDLLMIYSVKIVAAILVLIIGRWFAQKITDLFSGLLESKGVEQTLVGFLKHLVYYSLLTTVVIAAVNQLGVSTTSFLTIVGAAGLAIALALKDSLSNFSAGVMLILFRPFKIGDVVTTGGVTGAVKNIAIFCTELATPDNQKVIIPNSSIMDSVITNITANSTRRIDMVIGISYGDSIFQAKELLTKILAEEAKVLKDPAPTIAVSELANSSVNLVVRPWVKTEDYWTVRFALTEKIKQEFDDGGLNIPFPQQDVHLFVEKQ